jgi:peptidoglycan/xylan/chitin deacetylase (PgdA/CDA1 family)
MTGPIPILVYHRVDHEPLSTSTPPQVFRQHLMWLSRHGWRSLSPDEFAFYASRKTGFPARSFVLTFDDGYRSIASTVAPLLQELNFRAVCFAATRPLVDTEKSGAVSASDASVFLSWQQARELQSRGLVDFQSHTHAHRHPSQYTDAQMEQDLETSLYLLSSKLGLPKTHFHHLAWPWGESTPAQRMVAARCGFKYQYTVARAAFQHSSPLQLIPRTCYDGATYADFQMQFWLQCGPLSKPWHAVYPIARRLRRTRTGAVLQQGSAAEAGAKAVRQQAW